MLNNFARSAMSNFWWFFAASRILYSKGPLLGFVWACGGGSWWRARLKVGQGWDVGVGGEGGGATFFSSDVFFGKGGLGGRSKFSVFSALLNVESGF